jgi:hypothetical protein
VALFSFVVDVVLVPVTTPLEFFVVVVVVVVSVHLTPSQVFVVSVTDSVVVPSGLVVVCFS